MATKILAIGGIYLDINSPRFPFGEDGIRPNVELIGGDYETEAGGSAFNFAEQCVSLGIETSLAGKVGNDECGQIVQRLIEGKGVRPEIIISSSASTNISINLINPDDKPIMTILGSANQSLEADEIITKLHPLLNDIGCLYIGGCFKLTTLMRLLSDFVLKAKGFGIKVLLDHNRIPPGTKDSHLEIVRQLAIQSDYYLPSRDEFLQLWSVDKIEEGLANLKSLSTTCAVVKDGANGVVALGPDGLIKSPAFEVELLHSVGAGDSFNAGFIAAMDNGLSLAASMEFGCATAALKISNSVLPSTKDVQQLITAK